MNDRIGHLIAAHAVAMRRKYGRYPVPEGMEPLEGHEDDAIPKLPDWSKMEAIELMRLPMNREDERRRLLPLLPRKLRLITASRQRRRYAD